MVSLSMPGVSPRRTKDPQMRVKVAKNEGAHYDSYDAEVGLMRKLRALRYERPSGLNGGCEQFQGVEDLRDPKDACGMQMILRHETEVLAALRLDLPPRSGQPDPMEVATGGLWTPPEWSARYGRAFVPKAWGGLDLYRWQVAEAAFAAHALGLEHLVALCVETFPLLGKLEQMGFSVLKLGDGAHGGIHCNLQDGFDGWHLVPIELELSDANLERISLLQQRIAKRALDVRGLRLVSERSKILRTIQETHGRNVLKAA